MNLLILSREPKNYSSKRLKECAKEMGHNVRIINPLRCYMDINSEKPEVHYRDEIFKDIDAIIPRIGASVTFFGTAVVRQFEMGGVYSLNSAIAISRSRDKLRASQVMAQKGIGLPRTGFAHSTSRTDDLIKLAGGAPIVIKLLSGTQGKGVVLAETKKAAESVIDAFRGLDAHFVVQEFIREAGGSDVRCFVIGDKVIASMKRTAQEGEFRSNIHQGGLAEPVKITPTERRTAVAAAKAMGLNVAGVDLLRSSRGPLVLEVNSSPGLEGIEKSTNINVATRIIRFVENALKPEKRRKKPAQG